MTPNHASSSYAGKYVFVSGIAGGREVFLGRAIDEPFDDHLMVEGKPIAIGAHGQMVMRPFVTQSKFATNSPHIQIQAITTAEAANEVSHLFNGSINSITLWNYPLTYRWIESAMSMWSASSHSGGSNGWNHSEPWAWNHQNSPFTASYTGFQNSIEQFRRALFTSPQVTSTTEMDKTTELEGNLAIGFGKVTNDIAIKCNSLMSREADLMHYFEWIQAYNMPHMATHHLTGWCYLNQRMQIAKSWARRNGRAPLVREINDLYKQAVKALNEIILDHCSTLDTLITETCSQHGISFELYGEMSPFSDWSMALTGRSESYSHDTATGATMSPQVPIGV